MQKRRINTCANYRAICLAWISFKINTRILDKILIEHIEESFEEQAALITGTQINGTKFI